MSCSINKKDVKKLMEEIMYRFMPIHNFNEYNYESVKTLKEELDFIFDKKLYGESTRIIQNKVNKDVFSNLQNNKNNELRKEMFSDLGLPSNYNLNIGNEYDLLKDNYHPIGLYVKRYNSNEDNPYKYSYVKKRINNPTNGNYATIELHRRPKDNFRYTYYIEIEPTQDLVDAYNLKDNNLPTLHKFLEKRGLSSFEKDTILSNQLLKEQEENEYRKFLFSQREQQNSKRPVTDNHIEYLRYKKVQLSKAVKLLNKLNLDKKNPLKDKKEVFKKINEVKSLIEYLDEEISELNENSTEYLFKAISQEITNLSEQLDLDNTNFSDIKESIDFLYKMVKGVSLDSTTFLNIENISNFENSDFYNFGEISLALDKLYNKYRYNLEKQRNYIINNDISYVNNILNNEILTEEDIQNLYGNKNDISWMEKTFLGINHNSSKESIIPQILKSILETKIAIRESEVKRYKDRLIEAIRELGDVNLDFIFERFNSGAKTGNIIDVFTPEFRKELSNFYNIDKLKLDKFSKNEMKLKWLRDNTEIIDFRKIKAIKDVFKDVFPDQFNFSEEEMSEYENYLKNKIGSNFNKEVEKISDLLNYYLNNNNNNIRTDEQLLTFLEKENRNYNNPFEVLKFLLNENNNIFYNNYTFIPYLNNISFIPKSEKTIGFDTINNIPLTKNTGYYNNIFKDIIMKDKAKYKYWEVLRDIYSEYIYATYGDTKSNNMSYAKFEEEFIEVFHNTKGLVKGTKVFNQAVKSFKEMFYEKGFNQDEDGVKKNYKDTSKKEIYRLTEILNQKSNIELIQMAKDLNLNLSSFDLKKLKSNSNQEDRKRLINHIANEEINSNYSTDINKVTLALLDMAGLHNAKEDTLPIANVLLESLKQEKTEKGEERRNSIQKTEDWINRVIKNENEKYTGTVSWLGKPLNKNSLVANILDKLGQIPFIKNLINKEKFRLLSDNEKKLLEHLTKLKYEGLDKNINTYFKDSDGFTYTVYNYPNETRRFYKAKENEAVEIDENLFDKEYQKYLEFKINNLGLDLNTAGVIQGILKIIILKGLGLNPISGIFNRIEGKNSGLIMDETGNYWTKGNIHYANNFLAFSNFLYYLPERFTPNQWKKIKEIEKFTLMLKNINLIQDRKNELDRNSVDSKFNYQERLNIYQFAVDRPEFKNQGAIFLSILMDTKIKDVNGNEVSIFDGDKFPAHEVVNGKLVLKKEFKTPSNINNWENFSVNELNIKDNQYLVTRNKIKSAISRSQGNYDNLDVIGATKNIWGRALTLFMKWVPEHFMQRFSKGDNIDLTTGKKAMKGRYRYLWENNPALFSTGLITSFIGFGLTPVTGMLALGLSGVIVAKYFSSLYSKNNISREANNIKEFIGFTKSVLINTLNYPLEIINRKRVISQEIGDNLIPGLNQTNLSEEEVNNLQAVAKELGTKISWLLFMMLAKSLTWDDEDDESSKRRRLHNFLDNQGTKIIKSLTIWTNPNAFKEDISRFAFLSYLEQVYKFVESVLTFNEKGDLNKRFLNITPIPRLLTKGSMPYYDDKEWESDSWYDKYIKDNASEGEYSAKKEYNLIRKEKIQELKEFFSSFGYSGDELNDLVDTEIKRYLPKKKKGENYKSVLNRIEKGETEENQSNSLGKLKGLKGLNKLKGLKD